MVLDLVRGYTFATDAVLTKEEVDKDYIRKSDLVKMLRDREGLLRDAADKHASNVQYSAAAMYNHKAAELSYLAVCMENYGRLPNAV